MESVRTEEDITLIDPIDGQVVDHYDTDELILFYKRLKEFEKQLDYAKFQAAKLIEKKARDRAGDARTVHLKGITQKCTVVAPDPSYDQAMLRNIWWAHPEEAAEFMTIERLRVSKSAVNIADRTAGPEVWEEVRDAIERALKKDDNRAPQIKIDE